MSLQRHFRRVNSDALQATQPGRFTDVSIPQGSILSFAADPALTPGHATFAFEWMGRDFTAPYVAIQERSTPFDRAAQENRR